MSKSYFAGLDYITHKTAHFGLLLGYLVTPTTPAFHVGFWQTVVISNPVLGFYMISSAASSKGIQKLWNAFTRSHNYLFITHTAVETAR